MQETMKGRRVTVTAIKADVGSKGGHTCPSVGMMEAVRAIIGGAVEDKTLLDAHVTFTGDDIAILMSHLHGEGADVVHQLAWSAFLAATEIAKEEGLYGAGQDLLVDAPSGNVTGAGPGVAEVEFELLPAHRPAEAFMVFAGDKCAPGLFNLPLYLTFSDPMHNGGLLLSPVLHQGFRVVVIDMDHTERDRVIELVTPEESWKLAALLRDPDRFAVQGVYSRAFPDEKIVSVAAQRLHNIKGVYTGKDDPIMIARVQKIFPAPEEMLHPWFTLQQIVTGDCRGSHNMPIMPVAIETPVTGAYCLPIVSSLAFSMNARGEFSHAMVDIFDNPAWDYTRQLVQQRAIQMRQQGFFGVGMAAQTEIAYTGLMDVMNELEERFVLR